MTKQKEKGGVTLILIILVALVGLYFGLRYKEDIGNFFEKIKEIFVKTKTVMETRRPEYAQAIDTLKSFLKTLPKGNHEEIKKFLTQQAQEDKTWFEPWPIQNIEILQVNPLGPQNVEIETTITQRTKEGSPIHLDLNFKLTQEDGQWKIVGKAERK